jgi:hypothetical protein
MQRARFGFVRTVVSLTANRTLNSVFVERARVRFGVPNGLVATSEVGVGLVSEQVQRGEAKLVFEGPHDVERWDVRGRRGDVGIEHFVHAPVESENGEVAATSSSGLDERYVLLVVERDGVTFVMDANWVFREGDRVAVAIHMPEREDAIRALASRGWQPVVDHDGDKSGTSPSQQRAESPEEPSHD